MEKIIKNICFVILVINVLFLTSCQSLLKSKECIHEYYIVSQVAPTCDTEGKTTYKCKLCNETYEEEIAKKNHKYIKKTETNSTCKNKGVITYSCNSCESTYTEEKELVDHYYAEGYCTYCGISEDPEEIKCEHNYQITNETDSTCKDTGFTNYECINCDSKYTEEKELIDHYYVEGYCTYCGIAEDLEEIECEHSYQITNETDSTCKDTGFIYYECINCNLEYIEEKELVDHSYVEGYCKYCDEKEPTYYNPIIYDIFGNDTIVYDIDDENPYGIDLSVYGSNVSAVFYTPVYSSMNDPYINVTFDEFYSDYIEATSVEDAYYRTKHHFISGDITEQGHIPPQSNYKENDMYIRCTTATYVLSTTGEYIAYVPNDLENELDYIIYYGAGYQSINDVAAYLLAFGEVPANNNYNKNQGKNQAIDNWGIYGRVNNSSFSGDTSKYPYEPLLPGIGTISYIETDFGTKGGYVTSNSITGTYYNQSVYNNGNKITRGAARFVFVTKESSKSIDNRYVFYTYNHYNDFQEYLNYNDGFGLRFGNESAGNEYCGSNKDYYASNEYPITKYPTTILKKIENIKEN